MSLSYQERKAKGQRKRAEYLRRVEHAKDLSRMFLGVAVGVGFMFVMGIVARADRLIEIVFLIIYAVVIYFSLFFSQYVLFKAEQSRYPKGRRHNLWSLITHK